MNKTLQNNLEKAIHACQIIKFIRRQDSKELSISERGKKKEERLASSARKVQYWSFIFSIFSPRGKIYKIK